MLKMLEAICSGAMEVKSDVVRYGDVQKEGDGVLAVGDLG